MHYRRPVRICRKILARNCEYNKQAPTNIRRSLTKTNPSDKTQDQQILRNPPTLQLCPTSLAHNHGSSYKHQSPPTLQQKKRTRNRKEMRTLPHSHSENKIGGFPDDFARSAIAFAIRWYSICYREQACVSRNKDMVWYLLPFMFSLMISSKGTMNRDISIRVYCRVWTL